MRNHRNVTVARALAALMATTVPGVLAAPAAHAATPGGPEAYLELRLHQVNSEPEEFPLSWRSATLECHPPGASHPDPARACEVLEAAGGTPDGITPADGVCTLEYAPVEARATGHWRDQKIDYTRTFANLCVAVRETQGVFDI